MWRNSSNVAIAASRSSNIFFFVFLIVNGETSDNWWNIYGGWKILYFFISANF